MQKLTKVRKASIQTKYKITSLTDARRVDSWTDGQTDQKHYAPAISRSYMTELVHNNIGSHELFKPIVLKIDNACTVSVLAPSARKRSLLGVCHARIQLGGTGTNPPPEAIVPCGCFSSRRSVRLSVKYVDDWGEKVLSGTPWRNLLDPLQPFWIRRIINYMIKVLRS